jgi:soluble lytic murein transglycosylase-like protein
MWQQLGLYAAFALLTPVAGRADVFEIAADGRVSNITNNLVQTPVAPAAPIAARAAHQYEADMAAIGARYQLSPALVDAVAWAESRYRADAVSPKGAVGLMQLMPATARELGVKDARDPVQNIAGGAAYLRAQLDRFDGDIERALAAYNAGPGAVARYGAVPPYRETQRYVQSILNRLAQTALQTP